MLCKYYLQLGTSRVDTSSADCVDVSSLIANLDSLKVSYTRNDLGGVIRKCGSSIEFVGEAYEKIISYYEQNYLQSKGAFAVYACDNNWNYTELWQCPLDFATFSYDDQRATISCVDSSAAALIKANAKNKYEVLVSEIKDSSQIDYTGVTTRRDATILLAGQQIESESTTDMVSYKDFRFVRGYYHLWWPSINVNNSSWTSDKFSVHNNSGEGVVHKVSNGVDQPYLSNLENQFVLALKHSCGGDIISCLQDATLRLAVNFNIRYYLTPTPSYQAGVKLYFVIGVAKYINESTYSSRVVYQEELNQDGQNNINTALNIDMTAGEKVIIGVAAYSNPSPINYLGYRKYDGTTNQTYYLGWPVGLRFNAGTNKCSSYEASTDENPIYFDTIKVNDMLNWLLKSMSEGSNMHFNGNIVDTNDKIAKTILLAAESIRSITSPKIHGSFTDFCEFMESVFGYIYTISSEGYYIMDRELEEFAAGSRNTISHLSIDSLANKAHANEATANDRIYDVYAIYDLLCEENFGFDVDDEHGIMISNFDSDNLFYHESRNQFVYLHQDVLYTNWSGTISSSELNSQGAAKEKIGFKLVDAGVTTYWVVYDGRLVEVEVFTSSDFSKEENAYKTYDINFMHRSAVFANSLIKTLERVNNLNFSVDEGLLVSSLDVGYAKQDYDNENSARNEFNFTNHYDTGVSLSDTTLSLISPYRADCYGIEELILKTSSTESDDSDDDIFVVCVHADKSDEGKWIIDRDTSITGSTFANANDAFNAAFAPCKIIENNAAYLAAFTSLLKFTSSDGNSSAVIGDVAMNANISVSGQLFKAGKISIDTDDIEIPESWDGYIQFSKKGKTYKGYLESIDISFANSGTITYNLIEKCIE